MSDIFKKNGAEMLVLHLLSDGDAHGYELAQKIKKNSKGLLSVQLTSLYPVLYRLSDEGYITGVEVRAENPKADGVHRTSRIRVVYSITPSGREYLTDLRKEYDEYMHGYMNILASHGTGWNPNIT